MTRSPLTWMLALLLCTVASGLATAQAPALTISCLPDARACRPHLPAGTTQHAVYLVVSTSKAPYAGAVLAAEPTAGEIVELAPTDAEGRTRMLWKGKVEVGIPVTVHLRTSSAAGSAMLDVVLTPPIVPIPPAAGDPAINCLPGVTGCTTVLPVGKGKHTFHLVTANFAENGRMLTAVATAGSVAELPPTNEKGITKLVWEGEVQPGRDVRIDVLTPYGDRTIQRRLTIGAYNDVSVQVLTRINDGLHWPAGGLLDEQPGIRFRIPNGRCQDMRVRFRPEGGGSALPDTVEAHIVHETLGVEAALAADLDSQSAKSCEATTRWRLGSGEGYQQMIAQVIGTGARDILHANSRARPRFFGGVLVTPDWSLRNGEAMSLSRKTRDVKRTVDSAGATYETTTQETISSSESAISLPRVDATFGVDFGVLPRSAWTRRLRFYLGLSVSRPTERFFFGVSMVKLLFPALAEGSTLELYAGASGWYTDVSLGNGETEKRVILKGPSMMIGVNGGGLFDALKGLIK